MLLRGHTPTVDIAKTFPDWKFQGSLRNRYPEKTAQDFFFYSKCS